MRRTRIQGLLFSAAIGVAGAPYVFAEEADPGLDAQVQVNQTDSALGQQAHAKSSKVIRSSELLSKQVVDQQGQPVGQIQDAVVDVNRGRLAYAILSLDAAAGAEAQPGGQQVAVPWNALSTKKSQDQNAQQAGQPDAEAQDPLAQQQGQITLNISVDQLRQQGQTFDAANRPDMTDPQWGEETHRQFGTEPYWLQDDQRQQQRGQITGEAGEVIPVDQAQDLGQDQPQDQAQVPGQDQGQDPAQQQPWLVQISELQNMRLSDAQQQELGQISELVIDMREGRIAYAIVQLEEQGQLASVPWNALDVQAQEQRITLNQDAQALQATAFAEGQWPNFDEEYGRQVHRGFQQEPYWETFGYTDDESGLQQQGQDPFQQDQDAQQQDQGAQPGVVQPQDQADQAQEAQPAGMEQ